MVQSIDFTKPVYNAVNINIKKPEVDAGNKIKVEGSIGAKTSTKMKSDFGINASANYEGFATSISSGYLHLSEEGVRMKEIGFRGGIGASIGGKFGLKEGSIKGGTFSFSWNMRSKYYPY